MNLGVTLKAAEKVFGPALPGSGDPETTLSALPYAEGKGKKYAGIVGIRENARFYIHFPTPIDWSLLESKKGIPDFVNDLKQSGPQGEQGRAELAAEFLRNFGAIQEQRRAKADKKAAVEKKQQAAAEKKRLAVEKAAAEARRKEEAALVRERLVQFLGEQQVTLTIGSETITLLMKITQDRTGKLKLSAAL